MDKKSARDIEGEWVDPPVISGVIQRCRAAWHTPISELSDRTLATFLRQAIALEAVTVEARFRIGNDFLDGTELYEGELRESITKARLDDQSGSQGHG